MLDPIGAPARASFLWLVAACYADSPPLEPMVTSRVERLAWEVPVPFKLDVLFVVDNSPAMAAHLPDLSRNLPRFIHRLAAVPGGLPDLHLGVIATDDTELRSTTGVVGTFLTDKKQPDGSRQRNYTGALENVFAALASAGATGASPPPTFSAIARGLRAPGLLRPEAFHLAVIITANDGEAIDVAAFADSLRELEMRPGDLAFGLVAGPEMTSCTYGGASAAPAPRLWALMRAFPNRSAITSICQEDLSDVIQVAPPDSTPLGTPCFAAMPRDGDHEVPGIQPLCDVRLVDPDVDVPSCDVSGAPCWHYAHTERCLRVNPPATARQGLHAIAECLVE